VFVFRQGDHVVTKVSSKIILTALIVLVVPQLAAAQGANLEVGRQGRISCPAEGTRFVIGFLNRTGIPQTIAANTKLSMVFSAPVTEVPFNPSGIAFSFSANTLTAELLTSVTIQNDSSLFFNSVALNLQSATSRTPIAVTVTADPLNAVTFARSNTAILGLADPAVCQPSAQSAFTIEDLIAGCPSATEVAAFRAAVDLRLDSDPSAGTLVCRVADGSADLTRLEERTFQAFRIMEFLPFDAPLPWTSKPLYDWFTGAIRGIRYRSDIPSSFCCEPARYINIQTSVGVLTAPTDPAVVFSLADLFIHEARHSDGLPHTCGSWDQTLSELGAWGAVVYYNEWSAFRTGDFLKSKTPGQSAFYQSWAWGAAQADLATAICDHTGEVALSPLILDFGAQTVGVASAPHTLAITQTDGGPVTINGVSLEGANAADFTLMTTCAGVTLPPSCAAGVRFTPLVTGLRSAQLRVTFSGSEIQRTVTISGTGVVGSICSYVLSSLVQSIAGSGGFGTVSIAAADRCNWEAVSDAQWLSISSGRVGAGNGTLAFVATPNPSTAPRTGRLTIASQTFTVNQAGIVIAISDVRSAAGYGGMLTFASGSWLEIKGTGLASSTREWQASDFNGGNAPTSLGGVSVSINGKPGFIYFTKPDDQFGPSQVNVQAPADTVIGPVAVMVSNSAGVSNTFLAQKTAIAPGMLAPPNFNVGGKQYLVASYPGEYVFVGNPNLVAGAPFRPAKPKDVIWTYGIGFGDVTPSVAPGVIATQTTQLSAQVSFQFGQTVVIPTFAGLYPTYVGIYLFILQVPDVADGDYQIIVIVNGQPLPQTLYLTVKR
jgi:uncharacterized protein (TIGR03437 family)